MTTATLPTRMPSPGRAFRRARFEIGLAVWATLGVIPLSLLVAPGWWFYLGTVYAIVWVLLFIPSANALLVMLVEATRILRGRGPYMSAALIAARRIRGHSPRMRTIGHAFAEICVKMNPFTGVVTAILVVAIRARPEVQEQILNDALEVERMMQRAPKRPVIDVTMEVVEHIPAFAELQPC